MGRREHVGAAILAALLVLSACSPHVTPTPPPIATLTPITIISSPTQPPQPTNTATPTHPAFDGPLTVKITDPAESQVVQTSPVALTGQADPGTVITIGEEVILVDQSGTFQTSVDLTPGDNLIEITASDAQNAQDFAYFDVIYEPQP